MRADDFKKQIDALHLCFYLINHIEDNKKDIINNLGEIVYKEILQEAVLNHCDITYFEKDDTNYFYIRTEEISEEMHNKILKIIHNNPTYLDICQELKELGYRVPEEIIIL